MTTLVMTGILCFGALAYTKLPVSDLPAVDFPTINVSASLPGASPETMAAAVATPLEKQFSTIAGIDNMTSNSILGSTQITIQFALDRDINAAAQDVQAAISQALPHLPSSLIPPSFRKANPAAAPIMLYALTSSVVPLYTLDEIGETTIAQRISMVEGVAQVDVYGQQKYAVRVQVDPAALADRKIGMNQIVSTLNSENVNQPLGVMWGANQSLTLQATGELMNATEFGSLIVAYRNGAPVHLTDVAHVVDDVQNNKTAAWYNRERAVVLFVQRQPGTNTVAVANAVKQTMAELLPQIPPSVQLHLLYDRTVSIDTAVGDVKRTLVLSLVLVVLVIFVFLRNVSATVIPSMALPMSVIGTFSVMYLLGYSVDNLSLMALTLAVGFVVDDAIVMLENIVRHLEMGKPRLQAALDGAQEVGFTILSMTLSLAAVFIPLLFMGGIVGKLFHEFAVTIAVAILVSGMVSLTLTPMLSSRFLQPSREATHGRLYAATERIYEGALHLYERTLAATMRHRPWALAGSALILVGTVYLFRIVPTGLFPSDDTGQLQVTTEVAEGTSFPVMLGRQLQVNAIVARDSNIASFMSSAGSFGSVNQGRMFLTLKPVTQRVNHMRADAVAHELMAKLNRVPGIASYVQNPPSIRIGGRPGKSLYQFTLQGPDLTQLNKSALALQTQLQRVPTLVGVTTDLQITNPQVVVDIDRDRGAALGVTTQQIESSLDDAFGSRQVSTIYTPTNEYWVVMEVLPQFQVDAASLNALYLRSQTGAIVPLTSVVSTRYGVGPLSVNHSGQLPSVTVSFDVRPGVSLSQAVSTVQRVARQTLPSTITASFAGTAQAFQSSVQGLSILLLLTVFVIYIILGILYESFIHPITILSGLPFAAFGAIAALLLCGLDLDVYGFVGIVMLIGIVKKNAIMMIDFAVATERAEHTSPERAIVHAASIRFRPIMMTTVAALMGTLPIAIGLGASGASRRPLGVAVVGGLAFSQIVTLYITPVVYTYMDELQQWLATTWGWKTA